MNKLGIYVHIPFCESKCKYCNFISGIFSQDIQKRYVSALIEEIKREKVDEEELEKIEDARALQNISNMPARVKCAELAWYTMQKLVEL